MRSSSRILLSLAILAAGLTGSGARAAAGTFEGTFNVVYGDTFDHTRGFEVYSLAADGGTTYAVEALPAAFEADPSALQGERVRVEGVRDGKTIRATDVAPADAGFSPDDAPVTGSTAWAVLLCKYSDIPTETNPLSYYNSLMDGTYPRMDHYWQSQSYNLINLTGTAAYGWFTLPQPESYYINPANTDSTNLTNLANDCTAVANPSVNFSSFYGIIVMINGAVTGGAGGWGGSRFMTLDGTTKSWPFAWMPAGYHVPGVLGHEMGHGYGLPHSSAQPYPAGGDYQSDWDIMSSGFWNAGAIHSPYNSVGTSTISLHKDRLGWVSGARKFTPAAGSSTTITLWPMADAAPPGTQHLMAQIPIGATTHFYTVEARKKRPGLSVYDNGVPADGIVIHEVDPDSGGAGRSADALVVDVDGDYTASPDPGEVWVPGETFTDSVNGVSVQVLSANADGSYQVRIGLNAPGVTVAHTGGSTNVTEGGATDTYSIVLQSAPSATVTITPAHSGSQVTTSGAVTFDGTNWSTPKFVTVTAVDDAVAETSPHTALITHTASSADAGYNGISVASVTVNVTDNEPVASVSPPAINFGSVLVGQPSTTQTVTLTNTGSGTLLPGTAVVTGVNAADFAKMSDTCAGTARTAGQSCTITVRFTPSAVGTRTATLTIPHNAVGGSSTVSLTGTGTQPAVSLAPASMTFPTTTTGQQSPSQTATLTNTGTGTLAFTVGFGGANPGDFLRTGGTCGSSLTAGSSCTILVAFRPSASGARSASLSIASNAPGSPHLIPLSGTGASVPSMSLSRTSIPFGSVELGTTSAGQTVTATNTGGGTLIVGTATITGAFASAFQKTGDTCSGATIVPGGTCSITLTFRPGALGGHTASLSIPSNAPGSPHTVALNGTGVDSAAPGSSFATGSGSIKIAGLDRIEGSSNDTGSGVHRVTVYFTDLLGRTTQTLASTSCNAGATMCTWSAPIALLLAPGIYSVNARATDVAGNLETPGPTISIFIL